MNESIALVVTSIAQTLAGLQRLASGCHQHGIEFFIIGDEAGPSTLKLEGGRYYNLEDQRQLGLRFAQKCPIRHYARKNIGYLLAARARASVIMETDDDNLPEPAFWEKRDRFKSVRVISNAGFVNVYRYFSRANIWPRGLPLDQIQSIVPAFDSVEQKEVDCPIQQGLVDENPDVDAIYRLTLPLPQSFRRDRCLALGAGSWCPFNSQNTTWWKDAFPLLYLPSSCSFRMTDIWRSFVAQRIAWANGWSLLFNGPTLRHERNDHNLLSDFRDELPGYLNNGGICEALAQLSIPAGVEQISDNLYTCYETLLSMGLVAQSELDLLEAWVRDLEEIRSA